MKSLSTKTIVIGGVTTLVVAGMITAGVKASRVKGIFDLMEIAPEHASKFKIDIDNLKFNLDVKLTNNSDDDLFMTGAGIASLRSIRIYYAGTYMATADVDMHEIEIAGKKSLIIKNIRVAVDWTTVLVTIKEIVKFDLEKIGIIGIVEALGKTYEIGKE